MLYVMKLVCIRTLCVPTVWSPSVSKNASAEGQNTQNKLLFILNTLRHVDRAIFCKLHAAVRVYLGAGALANTVSDRDWCKINTSQECDVLIKSVCCSDRKARRVRGQLQRGPLSGCQAWPSKADKAVTLLIYFYWQAPKSSPKTHPSFTAAQKNMLGFKDKRPPGWMHGSKAKYILKANSLPFATCFDCCRSPSRRPAFRLNWQQLSERLADRWSSGALRWHLSGCVYPQGSAERPDSQDPLTQALPWVSPARPN